MKSVHVFMTMDCEPTTATTHPEATGPRDWAHGERAVRGWWKLAQEHGYPVTFFIHPETAIGQAKLWRELEAEGACLGLHMHPWKYSMWKHGGKRYLAHYGGLSAEEQHALLTEAGDLWADAIGHKPLWFRPGTYSANDAIFAVLSSLGYAGGSCSAPGRVLPEMQAIWTGAELDPHRANAVFRQTAGDLDFVNVPQSMDMSRLLEGRIGRRMYADLRPDVDWPGQYGAAWSTIATNILAQTMARNPAVGTIGIQTHNHYEYLDPGSPQVHRLRAMVGEVQKACAAAGVTPIGSTLADIAKAVSATPRVPTPFVVEGAIFESQGKVPTLDSAPA
jgi:hypothetical protein